MKIARKSGRGAISFSLFGFAELMDEAEYKNRVTMRHSMKKTEDEASPTSSAKQITTLEIALLRGFHPPVAGATGQEK